MNHLDNSTLNLYLDDALDAKMRGEVAAHLETCEVCQRELAATRSLFTLLETWRAEPIPRDVTAQVMTRIATRPIPAHVSRWGAVVLGVQVALAALILVWVLPTLLRLLNALTFQLVPSFDLDVFFGFSDLTIPFALPFPSVALWVWLAVLAGGVVLWFVGNRLLFYSLERTQEASQ